MFRSFLIISVAYLVLVGGTSFGVYQTTLGREFTALREAGTVRLSEAASRLRLQIDGYRELVNFVAGDPQMASALRLGQYQATSETLAKIALTYGAWQVDLVGRQGRIVASSREGFAGQSVHRSLLDAAQNGSLGFRRVVEDDHRLVRLSRGVTGSDNNALGIVVVSVDVAELEFEWPVAPEAIVFFDETRLAFSTNRPSLSLLAHSGASTDREIRLEPTGTAAGQRIWMFQPPGLTGSEVIIQSQFIPHLGLTGEIYLDVAPARATAQLRLLLVLALAAVLGLVGAVAFQQRRRFALEAQHSAELEARVEARTAELRLAQDELVEASKLAALGRLSAGVSHELNQPLAAILNFAENGQKFLARKSVAPAVENLERISDQVRRMTRIIGNLRAFARQEVMPTDVVDLAAITRSALGLMQGDLEEAGVRVEERLCEEPVHVLAGKVRLEQVVMNLVSNAKDAMQGTAEKELMVELSVAAGNALLVVSDTGPGIAEPDRVFEPFYTTKELGSSKGLGMGLALSYGIITRFGGQLTCQNTDGGAQFTISLPLEAAPDGQ